MRRREFIAGLGTITWPVVVPAQQVVRVRRIGALMAADENDPEVRANISALTRGLAELGWNIGRNVQIEFRFAPSSVDQMRTFARELVGQQPDLILANTTPAINSFRQETETIPILFAAISDPIGPGFVQSLARPGRNITGFINFEASLAGKWLELLAEIAPGLARAGILFNPETAPYVRSYFMPAFEAAAQSIKAEPIILPVHSVAEMVDVITLLGKQPRSGLLAMPDSFNLLHRRELISAATRTNVPTVYNQSIFVKDGGLLSYGSDFSDIYRRIASYVDRIFRGEKPADLPVQVPTKFYVAVNVGAAKALGLMVPQSILLRADEVIE